LLNNSSFNRFNRFFLSVDSHLHFHIVPRWNGDTNFMPVIAETKVISNDMHELYRQLKATFTRLTA